MSAGDPMDDLMARRHLALGRVASVSTLAILLMTLAVLAVDLDAIRGNAALPRRHLVYASWIAGSGSVLLVVLWLAAWRARASTADEAVFRVDMSACVAVFTTGTLFASLLASSWRPGYLLILVGGHALAMLALRLVATACADRIQRDSEIEAHRLRRPSRDEDEVFARHLARTMVDAV